MGDFSDLARHDCALKFWLPEPVMQALRDWCGIHGDSVSQTLRQFFAHHCYGVYAFALMSQQHPGLFKDSPPIRFSRGFVPAPPGKKRVYTYWVPELGKNVMPVKVWAASRMRHDLQTLADHLELNLSQYLREVVISRLLGHGTLPYRPEMLTASPLPAAQDWCDGQQVAMREVSEQDFRQHDEGEQRVDWADL